MATEAGIVPTIRLAFDHELGAYRAARQVDDPVAAWRALERAHIVSQTHLPIHMRVHQADRARDIRYARAELRADEDRAPDRNRTLRR